MPRCTDEVQMVVEGKERSLASACAQLWLTAAGRRRGTSSPSHRLKIVEVSYEIHRTEVDEI